MSDAAFFPSLCSWKLVVGVVIANRVSRCAVRRVSSAAMTATSPSTRSARAVMSSRLPMGVATTNSVPGIGMRTFIVPLADRMIASEPLPHFIDDLLGYLHEVHPTMATLDGVHTHDDLLEDFTRPALDAESHALAGYLRRLDEIRSDGLTPIERLEHRMVGDNIRGRMFELEDVRTWE